MRLSEWYKSREIRRSLDQQYSDLLQSVVRK